MATRYDLVDGKLVEAENGPWADFDEISKEHQAELAVAAAETANAQQQLARLQQGIRQAQADLAFVLPTDLEKEKSEMGQELDRLKARIGKL